MALESVPINTGTGPTILTDQSGTAHAQIVKVAQGADGTFTIGDTFAISGTVSVSAIPSVTVANTPTITVGNSPSVTVANTPTVTVSTGTVAISGVHTVTASQGGTWNIATLTTLLGVVAVSGAGGGAQYTIDTTAMGATGTGNIMLGMQSGATTARAIAITTSGAAHVAIQGTPTITGTVGALLLQALDATNDTIAVFGLQTGSALRVAIAVTTSGHQYAQVSTGTISISGAVPVIGTAHSSRWNSFAVNTTSGSSVILKTSGAHTLYVTDLLVSVDVPMKINFYSAATTLMSLYLATKGGMVFPMASPMVLTSAQSLTFQGDASGSCAAYAAGYTVT